MPTENEPRRNVWQRLWAVVDPNERYLRSIQPLVEQINLLEPEFETLTQRDLQDRLRKIRTRVSEAGQAVLEAQAAEDLPTDEDARRKQREELVAAEKAVLDEHLPAVFAAVREAAKRTLSMRHYDVQLLGGIVLHEGRIAEMKTGEGKTLTATLPLVLNALSSRGAHLITVNDYLARRDAEWMGRIYRYLGLSVGVIQHDLENADRQHSYRCDITYITNHEIGFDYLRDHSSTFHPSQLRLRELHYAIVDEVDSILVDEARVPLIISASRGKPVERYRVVQEIVSRLTFGEQDLETKETTGDFYVDEKAKNATLTEDGQRKVEIALGIDNLNDSAQIEDNHLVGSALKANFCYRRDIDYIVGPGDGGITSVIIVDTFTGRPQPGRRWSDGLHQAIEAKEGVPIQDEQQTIATVTYQNFFLMYDRLSGMTGTAKTEEAEFVEIYRMPVQVVPTNRPLRRVSHSDVVYRGEEWKFRGICCEIIQLFCRRQPVLVGTRSVETSEVLSARLKPEPLRLTLQFLLLQWHLMEHEKQMDKALLVSLRERSVVPLERFRSRDVTAMLQEVGLKPELDEPENWARLLDILEITDEDSLRMVLQRGVPHEVLNARHHEREAQIVAQAGRLGAVTIATNMAGRGTDIVLGGNPEPTVEEMLSARGIDPKSLEATLFMNQALKGDNTAARGHAEESGGLPPHLLGSLEDIRRAWQAEHEDVVETGGLHILGTERLESRRIDNQLRGRSGRQGDPGSARFYISLEDELMRLFGPDRWSLLMNQWPAEQPVEAKLVSRAMDNAQKKVEGRNSEQRKNTLRYDDVMNVQRKHIYAERNRILEGVDLRETVSHMMHDLVEEVLAAHAPPDTDPETWDLQGLWDSLNQRFPLKDQLTFDELGGLDHETLQARLETAAERAYDDKENDFIRSIVQLQLGSDVSQARAQFPTRPAMVAALCSRWPLHDVLPGGIEGVSDAALEDELRRIAGAELEAAPRRFVITLVRDRLVRETEAVAARRAAGEPPAKLAAELEADWPLGGADELFATLRDETAAEQLQGAVLEQFERDPWTFIERAVQRQMAETVAAAVPDTCDLAALLTELDLLWPLGQLEADRLGSFNYGVIDDRLRRTAEELLNRAGPALAEQVAEHRAQRIFAVWADQPEVLAEQLRVLLPGNVALDRAACTDLAAFLERHLDDAIDGVTLQAIEEAVVLAAVEAQRASAAGGEDDDEEEDLEFGELQRLVELLNRDWALDEALNAWELERLGTAELRQEIANQLRTVVRSRGQSFITATARRRLELAVRQAVETHFSREALCGRLNRACMVPGAFTVEALSEADTPAEMLEALTEIGEEVLAEEPDRLDEFRHQIRGWVDDGYSLRRLCDRINRELNPATKLQPRDLTELAGEELVAALLERLAEVEQQVEDTCVREAFSRHIQRTIDDAQERSYDLRRLSTMVGAAWPVRPDAVRPSKLKGWALNELADRLRTVLRDAFSNEPWRFVRRFVQRLLQRGLAETLDHFCPARGRAGEWDVAGLCAELSARWGLEEPLDPRDLPDVSRESLVDGILTAGTRAFGECERAFVRDTARHRFQQNVDGLRGLHYHLARAAAALNQAWGLGTSLQPSDLAEVRALTGLDPAGWSDAVAGLVDRVVEQSEATLLGRTVERRIADSVREVLDASYNVDDLVRALVGAWPLPAGRLSPQQLAQVSFADLVEQVRQAIETAPKPLQRRLVFFNLRRCAAEVELAKWLPADQPAAWQLRQVIAELSAKVPFGETLSAETLAGAVLREALAEAIEAAAAETAAGGEVSALLLQVVTAELDELSNHERRPGALLERLSRHWPLEDRVNASELRGKEFPIVREALLKAAGDSLAADWQAFATEAARRWAVAAAADVLERFWPETGDPGPWVLSQICDELNERWSQPGLLHPTAFRYLEREALSEALLEQAQGLDPSARTRRFLQTIAARGLHAVVATAAAAAVAGETLELDLFCAQLGQVWGSFAPTPQSLAPALTADLVARHLRALAEGLERRLVAAFSEEDVTTWLGGRLELALAQHCSLAGICSSLEARWPADDLSELRLSAMTRREMEQALTVAILEALTAAGDRFMFGAARLRLQADANEQIAAWAAGDLTAAEVTAHLQRRWGVSLSLGDPATAPATVTEAAATLSDSVVLRAFLQETVRRRVAQSVVETQKEHCDPEISSDRWDLPGFVDDLQLQWPVRGQLLVEQFEGLNSEQLERAAEELLLAAFDAEPEGFIRQTTRLRVGNSLREAIREHASLDRLAAALQETWPRTTDLSAQDIAAGRASEVSETLLALLPSADDGTQAAADAIAERCVSRGEVDLDALAAAFAQQWPDLPAPTAFQFDELLVAEHLRSRLWDEFLEDPRAFVRAVALEDVPRQLERRLMLQAIDTNWCDHLEGMDYLREGINLRGYGQVDPFNAYRKEGRQMFENMLGRVRETVVAGLFGITDAALVDMHARGRLGQPLLPDWRDEQFSAAKVEDLTASSGTSPRQEMAARQAQGGGSRGPVVLDRKVGRNDPCPCGSGQKYKHCCGKRG